MREKRKRFHGDSANQIIGLFISARHPAFLFQIPLFYFSKKAQSTINSIVLLLPLCYAGEVFGNLAITTDPLTFDCSYISIFDGNNTAGVIFDGIPPLSTEDHFRASLCLGCSCHVHIMTSSNQNLLQARHL